MSDQLPLVRILKLIRLLSSKPGKKVAELSSILDAHERSIYRDLKVLEKVGYLVDHDKQHRYFIFLENELEASRLFSLEEADLLNQVIDSLVPKHPLRQSLKQKIYVGSDLIPATNHLHRTQNAHIIGQLNEAMEGEQRVWLRAYQSSREGGSPRDRKVEPLAFGDDYVMLQAVEVGEKKPRLFKIDRIGSVEVLDEKRKYRGSLLKIDLFGMSGLQPIKVKLLLSRRARNLLVEEFPASVSQIEPAAQHKKYPFCYTGVVQGFQGIGRFILGLPGEIEVGYPEDLKSYLRERAEKGRW